MNILERNNLISQHMDIITFGGSAVKDKVKIDPMIFWNSFVRPPVNYYIPDVAIQRLREFNSSARLMNNPVRRFKLVNELLAPYGFKSLASGTNRRTFYCEYDPQIILKLASDSVGVSNNLRDIWLQNLTKPYVPKICSSTTDGILSLIERVEHMTEYEYRHVWANEIFDVVMTFLQRGLVMEDIGTNFFKNIGIRLGFGPVFLDAPDIYLLDPRKMKCIKVNPVTKQICGGKIDYNYDKGMSEIICTKCGTRYSAKYLAANEQLINQTEINTRRKFSMETNLKVNVVSRKDGSVINSYMTESDYQFPVPNMKEPEPVQHQPTFNPNVVAVQHSPEQIAQVQEPTQVVNNPHVVVVPKEHVESFKQFMAMKKQQEAQKEKKTINLFGKAFDADILRNIASKFKVTEISENSIINLFMAAILNKQTMETLMTEITADEVNVVNELLGLATKTIENNTNPALVNTNANDQVIEEPQEEKPKSVVITVTPPTEQKEQVPEPQVYMQVPPPVIKMEEFVGIPISENLKKEIIKLLPPIKDLNDDKDIRLYLGRQDVGQFLLTNIKDQNLLNELKNFGGFLAQKIMEDMAKADLKAKEAATYAEQEKVETTQPPKQQPQKPRQKIAPYSEFIKNDKTLIMYPKEVVSDIFWMLSRIEKKHSLDVANFLANRIGVDYISHEKFVPMKKGVIQNNDRPKTTVPVSNIVAAVNTTTDTSREVMTTPIASNLDKQSLENLEKLRATLPNFQPKESEKGEMVFQGVTKQVDPENWKQREEPKVVETKAPANNVVTANQATEVNPTEGLFPVKPQLENDTNTAYVNINTGSAVMGFPGEAKVDSIRIAAELPELQKKCYVRFNNFTPSNDPTEDFVGKMRASIYEYMAADVQKVMQDDGKGFGIRVLPTHDERNRDCYKVDAFNYGTQLFTTFIYPIGGQNEKNERLANGILYAQGKKAFDNFMRENPDINIPEEALKQLDAAEVGQQIKQPDIDINDKEALVKFFNEKIKTFDMTNITDLELGKRIVVANLQAALVDATRGKVTQDVATNLAIEFVKKHCNFSFA